tara:strand:- start:369 stop:1949 length:1581 start_codon:yes stop_codon:yes gene_type:complete
MAPPGGDKDIIPPELIEIIPPNGSTQFKGGRVELKFSEYLDENSLKNAIKIFPLLSNAPDIIFKGNRLFLEFSDSLPENQTIIIIINRNLADEHKIKVSKGLQIAYSTGESIDQGSIKGKIFYSKKGSVNLWKMQDDLDSLNYFNRIPDYVIDANDQGDFEFKYLSKGFYKIVAVDQSYAGVPILQDRTPYGLWWKPEIEIFGQNLENINIRIPEQKKGLGIVSAKSLGGKWGQILFFDNIDDVIDNFRVNIYYEDKTKAVTSIFKDPIDKKKINFIIDKMVDSNISVFIRNDIKSLNDTGYVKIKMDTTFDTTNIKIVHPFPKQVLKIENDSIVPLKVAFSNLIEISEDNRSFLLLEDSIPIKYNTSRESPLSVNITPIENWKPKKQYYLKIYQDSFSSDYSKGLKDSLITIPFSTKEYRGFGSLVIKSEMKFPNQMIAQLKPMDKNVSFFSSSVNSLGVINIEKLPEGDYKLFFFQDLDGDNSHSAGNFVPYQPSEWFQEYPDTVKIRTNWQMELDSVKINMKF